MVITRSSWVEVSDEGTRVRPSVRVVFLKPKSLIDEEPPSRIASRGSTRRAPESYWRHHCRGKLAVARCCCWVILTMALPRQCRPWHDVVVESYRRWHCQQRDATLIVARCRCWVDIDGKVEWLPGVSAAILLHKFFLYKIHTHMVHACLISGQERL
jgi:hypothetical protein